MPSSRSRPLALTLIAAPAIVLAIVLAGCQREAPEDAERAPRPQPAPDAMTAPEAEPGPPPVVADIRQTYQCGEQRVEARFAPDGVLLDIGGRQLQLPQTISASGARYGEGDPEFWTHGLIEARLTLNGETFDCTALDGEVRSPWSEARERDVGFRAVGSEPGWHVEVDLGEAPEMRLVLDYGERELTIPRTEPFSDGDGTNGFRGEVDGEAVELAIRREDCTDPMSGEAFDARATLDYQGRNYEACGRYLWD
jgi:putative lipoprotein